MKKKSFIIPIFVKMTNILHILQGVCATYSLTLYLIKSWTYINNNKIQPAPEIGEVFGKTIRDPFQQHLENEDVGENFISKFQYGLYGFPRFKVNVLKSLKNVWDVKI